MVSSRLGLVLRTLAFTLLVPGSVTVLVPFLLRGFEVFSLPLGPLRYVGLAILALGIAIYAWCARDFTVVGQGTPNPDDPPRKLVVSGLYRYSRNPMYLGVLTILLGETIWLESSTLLIYTVLMFIGFHLRVLLYEEPILRESFGPEFEVYCQRVRRWL